MIIILFAFLHKVVSFCLFFFFPSIKSVICYLTLQPSSFYLWCHHKGFHFCCWQQDKYLSIDLLWFKWKNVCFPLYMQHHYGRLRRCFLTTMLIFFSFLYLQHPLALTLYCHCTVMLCTVEILQTCDHWPCQLFLIFITILMCQMSEEPARHYVDEINHGN